MREQSEIAIALVHRLASHFEIEVEDREVDRDASLLDGQGFVFDGQLLDSFDLVDALTTLEEELHVRLSDGELQVLDSINRLAEALERAAPAETVEQFCARWL